MTTTKLGLATKSAATLSTSTAMKEVGLHLSGQACMEEARALPFVIQATPSCGSPRQDGDRPKAS